MFAKMQNKEIFNMILIWVGTGTTLFLTVLDLVISIAVGIATLTFTAVKLLESWKSFRAHFEIEKKKEEKDEHRTKKH